MFYVNTGRSNILKGVHTCFFGGAGSDFEIVFKYLFGNTD